MASVADLLVVCKLVQVDFVSPNVFPFWDKIDADKGPAQLYGKLQNLAKIAKGKDIVIGETGWPTDGVEAKGSKASMANAATYFEGFYKLAQEHDLKYYYFAGFDEDWKIATSSLNHTVEAYFGIFDKDGNIKDAYTALKSDDVSSSSSSSSQVGDVGSASASASGSVDAGDDLPTKSSTVAKGSSSGSSSSDGDVVAAPASSDGSVSGSAVTTTTAPTASTISFSADELVAGFSSDLEESDDYVPGGVSGAVTDVDSSNASSSEDAATGSSEDPAASATTATAKASKKRKDCDA